MEETNTNQNQMTMATDNSGFLDNNSFMTMRLNTEPLIEKYKMFLESKEKRVIFDKETKEYREEYISFGLPLASPEGIMRLTNMLMMRVNHHISQGYIKDEHYWDYISRARKEVTETLIIKCYDWKILDSNLNMIIDETCALIELFVSRAIDNKERDSFNQTIKESSSIVQNEKSRLGGLSAFGGGFNNA